ncbi:MAG: cytidylate kinase-like family protein [Desulfobacteraceae bacterium]|nr:cytidylate kinase-like family protein [Desulfobacteraceae bacterium]MBC2756109.1 cytidylate kinase-like family protein [Desulfobacteraceae bacterium]MBC2763734.1 cytidylate kinase-like family protein [ANME-2 cluster archaeon]
MANSNSSKGGGKVGKDYIPGMYKKERPTVYETVEKAFQEWEKSREIRAKQTNKNFPIVCFSRKIGVGALEIADIIGKKIGYAVIDREILEHLSGRSQLDDKLSAFVNERCPGEMEDIFAMFFGVKAFTQSEYSRLLFRTIFSFAEIGPSIFVGRGAHLILPRDRVLSVRLICSNEYRVKRLADNLNISTTAAKLKLNHFDVEQKNFFRRIYNLKKASPYEFDMVINRDYIQDAQQAAEIIITALIQKFGMVNLGANPTLQI